MVSRSLSKTCVLGILLLSPFPTTLGPLTRIFLCFPCDPHSIHRKAETKCSCTWLVSTSIHDYNSCKQLSDSQHFPPSAPTSPAIQRGSVWNSLFSKLKATNNLLQREAGILFWSFSFFLVLCYSFTHTLARRNYLEVNSARKIFRPKALC